MAGVPFDHYVYDNGSLDGTAEWLKGIFVEPWDAEWKHEVIVSNKISVSSYCYLSSDNKGQCIASNACIGKILDSYRGYDFVLRFDNDIIPRTSNFLAELLHASQLLGPTAVVSPTVKGLLNPPAAFGCKQLERFNFDFVEILGGACRLMPAATLRDFKFSEHGTLSLGEATKFAAHCMEHKFPMAYVENIVVEHDTAAHLRDNPAYFERRRIEEYIPYGL